MNRFFSVGNVPMLKRGSGRWGKMILRTKITDNTEGIPNNKAVLKSTFPCLAFPVAPTALATPTTKRGKSSCG